MQIYIASSFFDLTVMGKYIKIKHLYHQCQTILCYSITITKCTHPPNKIVPSGNPLSIHYSENNAKFANLEINFIRQKGYNRIYSLEPCFGWIVILNHYLKQQSVKCDKVSLHRSRNEYGGIRL